MESTRITVVLDIDHEPEIDLPHRAACVLESLLQDVEGLARVAVVRGETETMVWMPPPAGPGTS
jgi:hypothetical protein